MTWLTNQKGVPIATLPGDAPPSTGQRLDQLLNAIDDRARRTLCHLLSGPQTYEKDHRFYFSAGLLVSIGAINGVILANDAIRVAIPHETLDQVRAFLYYETRRMRRQREAAQ